MRHPTDDMLLAYIRQQQGSLWPSDIQEHIASCSSCSKRCAEFKLIGSTLEAWARTSNENPLYATVSKRVMRTIQEPKIALAERMRRSIAQVHVALPVAVVFIILVVLLVGLGVNIVGKVAKSQPSEPTPPMVSSQPTAPSRAPIATLWPIPTVAVSPTVTVPSGTGSPVGTTTPHSGASIKVNASCTTTHYIAQNQLRVCGANFTPHTTVVIYYHTSTDTKKHTVQVAGNGTFTDIVYFGDCKDVPSAIYAQDTTNSSETAKITHDITVGIC